MWMQSTRHFLRRESRSAFLVHARRSLSSKLPGSGESGESGKETIAEESDDVVKDKGGQKSQLLRAKNDVTFRTVPVADDLGTTSILSEIKIDRSGLVNIPIYDTEPVDDEVDSSKVPVVKSPWTPVLDELVMRISVRGPITVSEFMTVALSHPIHGYYMCRKVFGSQGDFTTSPEISQVFGELLGVWCVANWMALGEPAKVKVVELGPGRGSLMNDLLRAASSFPKFCDALKAGGGVKMVETSPALRKIQQQTLRCLTADGLPIATQSKTQELNQKGMHFDDEWEFAKNSGELARKVSLSLKSGREDLIDVRWFRDFKDAVDREDEKNRDVPVLLVAQELFDALPIHQFEFSEHSKKWVERLVDIDPTPETTGIDKNNLPDIVDKRNHLRFVLSRGQTPACKILLNPSNLSSKTFQPGESVEVGAAGAGLIQDITKHLSKVGGAAIVIDYGENFPGKNSLRGIKDHKFVDPLSEPGLVDLSADVDFNLLKRVANEAAKEIAGKEENSRVRVVGPITQGDFLRNMGIETRVAVLLQATQNEEEQEKIFLSFKRLVDGDEVDEDGNMFNGMGQAYKALALMAPVPGGRDLAGAEIAGFPVELPTVDGLK